jgi:hypothetical protein
MPVSEVESVDQAPDRLVSIVETALGEALGDPSLRFKPTKWGPDSLAMYPSIPGCTGECRVGLGYFRDPDLGEAPSLLGGGPAYEWRTTRFKKRAGFGISAPGLSDTELLELYAAVSRSLPEWAYIYLSPGYYGVKSLPAPIILSQGRSLLFVEPGALPESSDFVSASQP